MAEQKIHTYKDDENITKFVDAFKHATKRGYNKHEVWSAFVTTIAADMALACDCATDDFLEKAKELSIRFKDCKEDFVTMFQALVDGYDKDSRRDILGRLYSELDLADKSKQQFFTPYSISELMANLIFDDTKEQIKERGFITITDPAVGAGGLLIAARNKLISEGANLLREVWFDAKDLSMTAALMCYIQMTLLSMAGRVVVGDAMSDTTEMELYTLVAVINPEWKARGLCPIFKNIFEQPAQTDENASKSEQD